MFSGIAVAALVLGAPVKKPEVNDAESLKQHMGNPVVLVGQVERVNLAKGKSEWEGTALVLDDDTRVYLTYGAPPPGWEALVGERVRVEGLLLPSLSDHEQSLLAPHLREPGKPKKDPRKLRALVGQRVRLSGSARDAKGGAVLMLKEGPVYLAGVDAWPAGLQGKQVAVGGTLVDKPHLLQATQNAKGEWTQGAQGTQLVLEAPVFRALQEPTK